jgi:uncharacterized protein YbjT (DUF2867 family)
VKALVRSPEKAEGLKGSGVEPVVGDFDKPETLSHALAGVGRVFLLSAPDARMVERETDFIKAAQQAGVRHVVKLSAFGVGEGVPFSLGRWHQEVERNLEKSGVAYTILRPNGFMQNMFGFARTIREQGVFYAPLGETRISSIDARDIASVAARALTEAGHEGRTYELTGPEALSYNEIAGKLSTATGVSVKYVSVPMEAARQGMVESGMPAWLADALVELFEYYIGGGADRVTNDVRQVTGREAISFDQFASDYAGAFKRK